MVDQLAGQGAAGPGVGHVQRQRAAVGRNGEPASRGPRAGAGVVRGPATAVCSASAIHRGAGPAGARPARAQTIAYVPLCVAPAPPPPAPVILQHPPCIEKRNVLRPGPLPPLPPPARPSTRHPPGQVAFMTNPIWLIKTRLQLQGNAPSPVHLPPAAAAASAASMPGGSAAASGAAAAAAGAGPPAFRPYTGFADALLRIGREEGIRAYYRGLSASMVMVSGASQQLRHLIVTAVHRHCWKRSGRSIAYRSPLCAGEGRGGGGCRAAISATPHPIRQLCRLLCRTAGSALA